jgi:hypothetical protein
MLKINSLGHENDRPRLTLGAEWSAWLRPGAQFVRGELLVTLGPLSALLTWPIRD